MGNPKPLPPLVDVVLPVPIDKVFTYKVPSQLAGRVLPGCRVLVPFGNRRMTGCVVALRSKAPGRVRLRSLTALVDDEPLLGNDLLDLARWISDYYVHPIGEVLGTILPAGLKGKARFPPGDDTAGKFPDELEFPVLNSDQVAALEAVTESLFSRRFGGFLVHGVTGSGKTEVYLRCIDEALRMGRSALVLIPEIALIPQTTSRFRRRFGEDVAVLHSRLTGAQRYSIWKGSARGEIRVVIGARSAVFVPLQDLGIIVVDEEQDASFKQEEKPHYSAVAVAGFRARKEGTVLLLGSATPSLETYKSARSGEIKHLRLTSRPSAVRMPRVEIVDMRGRDGIFSEELLDALDACLKRGEQAIILLNRRGHANFVQCRKCGWIKRCPNCSISLTYHSRGLKLICHYCGFKQRPPDYCPECGAYKVVHRGVGTQRIEMELGNIMVGARVARMDLDTTRGKKGHLEILERFSRGEAEILLGTQMVAKGHHYPNVTVVGVLSADWGLNFPDFRASERMFQLLSQAAGRTGRGEKGGRVIVQTFVPDHHIYDHLVDHDYEDFADRELALRSELGYPPSRHLILFTVSSNSMENALEGGEGIRGRLDGLFAGREIDVLGPTPALVERLRGKHRVQILVKGSLDSEEKRRMVRAAQKAVSAIGRIDLQWNIDPIKLS